jgi:hypothetical protein
MPVTANSIITPQTPKSGTVVATTANTTYTDVPTNTVKLVAAGPNGARVTRMSAVPRETVTDCQLQIFRSSDAGATKRFFNSARMAAYTMVQTTAAPVTDLGYSEDNPLILAANEEVWVGVGITKAVVFTAEWADY